MLDVLEMRMIEMKQIGYAILMLLVSIGGTTPVWAVSPVVGDSGYDGRVGVTLYVSKAGDNTTGQSWATAFGSIQRALNAIPDDRGGHRVIVRPDHYMEANLETPHPGAAGAYNLLIGDVDGKLGSGATGWVVIDAGDEEKGFKSWDWWSTMRASTTEWHTGNNKTNFSSVVWDRWAFRYLYATGGDAGLFWDLTHKSGEGFSVRVEDCVGIGRAFGGGLCYPVVRPGEPSLFRRCYFMALDWGGDTGAVLVGGWETQMPNEPHAVFEDCIMVHPDNAVQVSFASKCVRVRCRDCRMMVLNFSQPSISPSTGIICSEKHPDYLHIDLEDSILAGYQVFGTGGQSQAIGYTTRGTVQAYLQFQQATPDGFSRLTAWPTELFAVMAPPRVVDGVIQWAPMEIKK